MAIDPGASGGIAILDDGVVSAVPMPKTMTEICDAILAESATNEPVQAVLERVGGYRPGNSGPSAAKFAEHVGVLKAALYMANIPLVWEPTPNQWMSKIGCPKKMAKTERKHWLKNYAARRYPYLSLTLKTSDAVALVAAYELKGEGC